MLIQTDFISTKTTVFFFPPFIGIKVTIYEFLKQHFVVVCDLAAAYIKKKEIYSRYGCIWCGTESKSRKRIENEKVKKKQKICKE